MRGSAIVIKRHSRSYQLTVISCVEIFASCRFPVSEDGGRRAEDGGCHFSGSVFSSSKTSEFISSVLNPAALEGLGTAPPLGLHWGVIFMFLKRWLFFVFSAYWTDVLRCRRLTNQCFHLFRLRLQFLWHGFHGLHGFFMRVMRACVGL